jgi:hypothetical protein
VSWLRDLRKLVLGETLLIPLGVALLVAAGVVADHTAGEWWDDIAGPVLVAGVVAVVLVAVGRGAR